MDIGPRRRTETEQVVREALDDETIDARGNDAVIDEPSGRTDDGAAEQRQWIGALLVDVGQQQALEIVEEAPNGLDDHGPQLRVVGERWWAGAADRLANPGSQPAIGPETSGGEQPIGWRGRPVTARRRIRSVRVRIRRHVVSSIVAIVIPLHRRTVHGAQRATTLAALVGFAGCTGGGAPDAPPVTAPVTTITTVAERTLDGRLLLGVYLPQTGPGSTLGQPMIAAVEETVDQINDAGGVFGRDVDIVILDEGATIGPSTLLEQGVDAIVGPASSRSALAHLASIVGPSTGVVTCSPAATALSLDDYPDNGYFFRTAPSDTLQMAAIARRAERTGASTVAVGSLDDPYGRGLARSLVGEIEQRRRQLVVADVTFSPDQEDLSSAVDELLAGDPGVVVVLGDADDGGRLLAALDTGDPDDQFQVIANDSIRSAPAIQQLSPELRSRLTAVAPVSATADEPGPFTAQVIDCVALIALAAVEANSDDPSEMRLWMAPVSGGGRQCSSFADCSNLQRQGLQIDYNGRSGPVEWSSTTGDPTRAPFVQFSFDADGNEIDIRPFEAP